MGPQTTDSPPFDVVDSDSAESVVAAIDALEELVSSGRRLPFSSSVVVNEDETLQLIDRARLGLPEDLVRARHTVQEREQILEAAEQEAQSLAERAEKDVHALLSEAETRAQSLLADHEVVRIAQEHAVTIVEEAEQRAASIRSEADAYARQVMEELETQLTRSLSTVRKGLETLPKENPRGRKKRA